MNPAQPIRMAKKDAASLSRVYERRFYTVVAISSAFIVVLGFARTYFFRSFFFPVPLSTLLHLHGLVTTLWFFIFFLQVRLVAAHRVDLHRRLGLVSVILAPSVFILGLAALIAVGRSGFSPDRPPAPYFVAMILVTLIVFLVLTVAGFYFRRRSDIHKRLMTLATISMLTPAIARIPLAAFRTGGFPTALLWTDLCVALYIAYDTTKRRRLHPALVWGTLLILAAQPTRFLLVHSRGWQLFVHWLLS
jgi:hypothetical protein